MPVFGRSFPSRTAAPRLVRQAPEIDAAVTPGAISAPWTMPAPTVFVGDPVTLVQPGAISAPWTMPAPAISVSVTVSPSPVDAPWTVPDPDLNVPVRPGDNITSSGQIEWNGFLLGSGTPYSWKQLDGWYVDLPQVDSGNVPQPNRHGSYSGPKLGQERIVTFTGLVKAARAGMEQVLLDLVGATGIYRDDTELPLAIRALGQIYVGYGSVIRRASPFDKNVPLGLGNLVVQWALSDPVLLSDELANASVADGATQTLTNLGNTDSFPFIRVLGPVVDPTFMVERGTDVRVLEFDVSVPTGQRMIVDTYFGTATVNGADVSGTLTGSSTSIGDLVLPAGQSGFSFGTTPGTSAAATVLWRHAIL
jgi:hypothetical protein